MSDSALSKAWKWSVEASPLLNAWRWLRHMGYPNHKAFALLDAADLPKPIDAVLRKTIVKSKLWATERAEIARELIAHTQDAIEAGRGGEEIASAFGNPKRIAKLMRRSMKRKRPLYWRAYRNMKRATAAMALVLIVGYGSLAVRFFVGTPSVKRNYIAELNAQNDGYTEDEKAWSVYRSVDIAWQKVSLSALDEAIESDDDVAQHTYRHNWLSDAMSSPHDSFKYVSAVEKVRAFEPQLALLREAAMRPVSGVMLSDQDELIEVEPGIYVTDPIKPSADPSLQGTLTSVLLLDVGYMQRFCKLLSFDAQIAMGEGDWDRAHADLIACLGISRQANHRGFLINHLVAIAIFNHTGSTLEEIFAEYPDAFSREQLIELSHAFALNQSQVTMKLDAEMMFFDDILQRAYTDDGHGNGRLTRQGMRILLSDGYSNPSDLIDDSLEFEDVMKTLTGPISMIAIEDRRSQYRKYRAVIDRVFKALREGPESLGEVVADGTQAELSNGRILRSPVDLLMPALSQAVAREFISQMFTDATLTMLGIEIFKREHGDYPETLDELVPRYLPELPADYFNPGHPIQYVIEGDGYLLYSAGTDGDLDGGVDLKPANSMHYSLMKRFAYQTVTNQDGIDEIARDEAGKPIMLNPTEPDSDWNLIDLRRLPEPITDE